MSRSKDRKESRRKLRRRLESLGWKSADIEAHIWAREAEIEARYNATLPSARAECLASARGEAAVRLARLADQEADLNAKLRHPQPQWVSPDDRGYQPSRVDPVLVGPARATAQAAACATRRRAMTKAQYERWEGRK